jgi:hypothetical protein
MDFICAVTTGLFHRRSAAVDIQAAELQKEAKDVSKRIGVNREPAGNGGDDFSDLGQWHVQVDQMTFG